MNNKMHKVITIKNNRYTQQYSYLTVISSEKGIKYGTHIKREEERLYITLKQVMFSV